MGRGGTSSSIAAAELRSQASHSAACVLAKVGREHGNCEDAVLEMPEIGLALVADGMGGPGHGDVASKAAVEAIREQAEDLPPINDVVGRYRWAQIALEQASYVVSRAAIDVGNRGAGTTAALALLVDDPDNGPMALVASVGDSRAYHVTAKGEVRRLTNDGESLPDEAIDQLDEVTELEQLSPSLRRAFRDRNVVSDALGVYKRHEAPNHVESVDLAEGDCILLTSDGVHDNLTYSEIAEICATASGRDELVERLAAEARARSLDQDHLRAKDDDISAVVLQLA